MSDLYTNLKARSQALISKYGRDITLRKFSEGEYNPETDIDPTDTVTEATVKGVFRRYREHEIDGTLIQRGDIEILMAPAETDSVGADFDAGDFDAADFGTEATDADNPRITYEFVDGESQYNIINLIEIKPGDTVLLYKAQARR